MNRILILGGSGLVGKAVINEMSNDSKFDIYATYYRGQTVLDKNKSCKLNIENEEEIENILKKLSPNIVISCLRGIFDKQLILHKKVAEYLKSNGGILYFFSTANVFDNDLGKSHNENDEPNSHTDYGNYKIACEKTVRKILNDNATILRIPQVWGKDCPRLNKLASALKNNERIGVYPNLFINTITDEMIAKKLLYIIKHNLKGFFHITSVDLINYKDLYEKLALCLGYDNESFNEIADEKGYFSLISKRENEFPEKLRFTNKMVIDHMIDKRN